MSQPFDVADISRLLSERAEDVCKRLLPGGKMQAGQWVVGDVAGSPGQSCKVNLTGEHAGHWRDWSDEAFRGDLIDLWEAVCGVTKLEAIRQAKDFLGIKDAFAEVAGKKHYPSPKALETHREAAPTGQVMNYLVNERKLEPSIINRFKVHADTRGMVVYPRYSPTGKLLNRQYIGLKRDDNGKKKVFCETGCPPALFGWQALSEEAFRSRTVLICEGEIDAMTWTQWGIPALSISNGSGTKWIDFEWENLEPFSTILLSLDCDGKSEGNLRTCVARLGIHRCRIVELPHKDANDCLKAGCTAEEALTWVQAAKWMDCKDLSTVDDLRDRLVEEMHPSGGKEALGWRPSFLSRIDGQIEFLWGEVTVWTGISSHGKSTFLNFLMSSAIACGQRVCIASFETKPEKNLSRMVRTALERANPTVEDIDTAVSIFRDHLCFVNRVGCMDPKELLEVMRFAYARYEIRHFVIDSLMRVNGLEEDYPAQGEFLNRLQEFAKGTGAHIHLVCHPRKGSEDTAPGKMDVKGASLILNNADNLLVVQRNMEKVKVQAERPLNDDELTMWDTKIVSRKQRESGWEGAVLLSFCPRTYRFWKCLRPAEPAKQEQPRRHKRAA